jgi:ketosteroid isomerase-like protein
MSTDPDATARGRSSSAGDADALLSRGLAALAAQDWDALRAVLAPGVSWHVPGRSPLAGTLIGADAVVGRWRRLAAWATGTGSRPPRTEAVLRAGTDVVALVQRNDLHAGNGWQEITVVTLLDLTGGRVSRIRTLVSDQYAVDSFWTRVAAESADPGAPHRQPDPDP